MTTPLATIEIAKEYLHFSAAHFTIFSATERERLHGHNWRLAVEITGEVDQNGLCFDYAIYKEILKKLCHQYDEYILIAADSPHLTIVEDEEFYQVTHNRITQPLLKTDTILLPILNVTIECLAQYFLQLLTKDKAHLARLNIKGMRIKVSSGPNQWGVASWGERA